MRLRRATKDENSGWSLVVGQQDSGQAGMTTINYRLSTDFYFQEKSSCACGAQLRMKMCFLLPPFVKGGGDFMDSRLKHAGMTTINHQLSTINYQLISIFKRKHEMGQ